MITDYIEKAHAYSGLNPVIVKALRFLQEQDFTAIPDGRYAIDGEELFYIVQRYQTKPWAEGKLEAHRQYIDVQYIVQGAESIGYSPIDNLQLIDPYDAMKDVAFYAVPQNITTLCLQANMFSIFFPHDAHMPSRYLDQAKEVLKVVVKIKA